MYVRFSVHMSQRPNILKREMNDEPLLKLPDVVRKLQTQLLKNEYLRCKELVMIYVLNQCYNALSS